MTDPATVPHPPRVDGDQFEQALEQFRKEAVFAERYGSTTGPRFTAARQALLDQWRELERDRDAYARNRDEHARTMLDLRAELAALTRAAPEGAEESVEGVVREGQVRGSMWIIEPVIALQKPNSCDWPIGSTVTVTRRRAPDQEGEG